MSRVDATGSSARWCARGDINCDDLPSFRVGTDDREANVTLAVGNRARIALEKRIETAGAAAAAASARKPTF